MTYAFVLAYLRPGRLSERHRHPRITNNHRRNQDDGTKNGTQPPIIAIFYTLNNWICRKAATQRQFCLERISTLLAAAP
jgi:hypothetical protein